MLTIIQASLTEAIKSRVLTDSHSSVVDAVYSMPTIMTKMFGTDTSLLSKISSSLTKDGQQPSRALVRAHLAFCTSNLYEFAPDQGTQIITSLVLPFCLMSKPRLKTATAVWTTVLSSPLIGHPLLRGVAEIVKGLCPSPGEDKVTLEVEDMVKISSSLVDQFAGASAPSLH